MNRKKLWLICTAALGLSYGAGYANTSASVDVNSSETTVSTKADVSRPHRHHHMRTARHERFTREEVTFNERRYPPLTEAELREAKLKLLSSKLPDNERQRLQAEVDRTEWIMAQQGDFYRTRHFARLDDRNGRFESWDSTTETRVRRY